MKVHQALDQLPKFKNAVITIGSFDGVHCGHQKIIEKVKQLAQRVDGESILITFHPHPRQIIYPRDTSLKLITTIDEKVRLFERFGVDHVVIVPFTIEFSQQSADEYIQKFLLDKFNPKYIVIGYDHRFGLNRQGDINYLQHHGEKEGFKVVEIPRQDVEDIGVSSTKIRKALDIGDVQSARRLLGHYFTLSGKVVHGQKIGHALGFPTANLDLQSKYKLIPPNGIYAVHIHWDGVMYDGMLYIGNRPTIKEHDNQTIEVNIFDFDQNIYGQHLVIELVSYIRDDMQFGNLEELKAQLQKDRVKAQEIIEGLKNNTLKNAAPGLPEVAVVILNYNGRNYLEKFLPTVEKSLYDNLEIIVADNGSTDDSVAFLQEHFPQIKCLQLKTNYGFAEGYNQALAEITADYYVLLNSDVEVTSGWLMPMITYLEKHPQVGACQPKIKSQLKKDLFEYAGASGGWMDTLGYPFCRGRIFDLVEKDIGQYDDIRQIFWASGAALVIRASLFHRIGGFDGDYFAHAEEIDLCWRLKRAGYQVVVIPEAEVYHVGGGTLEYNTPRKAYLNFRNSLFTLLKNEPVSKLLWLLPLRFILDGLAGVLFLSQGKYEHIKSIVRAHWSFLPNVGKAWKKRQDYNERIRATSIGPANQEGVYEGSVVWQYYAAGKNRFKQLIGQMKTPLDIIYEDDSLIVVNKPAGLLSIPDRYDANKPNLYHILLAEDEEIRIVHRLDRETSGAICFAKTEAAHRALSLQFEERTTEKLYLALVDGHPTPEEGSIDRPIARHPAKPGRMIVTNKGKEALTTYKIIESFKLFSLVEVNIHTGRTHQIRVHFQAIGHSLAVDPMYGKREGFLLSEIKRKSYRLGKFEEERPLMSRTTLHASQLTLQHPDSGAKHTFEAPLPKDFQAVIKQLQKWGK